jgi:hypothetical protein
LPALWRRAVPAQVTDHEQRLALSVTGGVLLVFANYYPVMTIGMQG